MKNPVIILAKADFQFNFHLIAIVLSFLSSCTGNYTPKPSGFLRIEPPTAQYTPFEETELPYAFSVSRQTAIELHEADSAVYMLNIDYPAFNAKIFCTYQRITPHTLNEHTAECIRLAEKVARNAKAITEQYFENTDNNVFGTLLLIEGDTPSPIQFMLTDSISHFFRGALYYNFKTNADSIAPVTKYLKNDISELIQTFYWK
jgi:hypothetical protein